MWSKISKSCAAAACIGLAASVAFADPNDEPSVANPYGHADVARGEFYFGAAGGVSWMDLPGWEYGTEDTADPVKPAFEIEGDDRLYGGQAWAGVGVSENTRIQLEGSYGEGDLGGRQLPATPDAYVLLDASASQGIEPPAEATLGVDVRGWEAGLRALTNARSDTLGTFTPSLMVFGGAASQDYDAEMLNNIETPASIFESFARQDIDTWHVGVEAALTATVTLSPALTVTLGGRVAGLYFDADMDGEDCIDDGPGSIGTGCDEFLTSSVSDDLDAVTYRAGGFAGTSYDFGGVSIGIMGTADYVPMADIVNPRFVGDSPSHLDLSHEFVFGVRGYIVIPLE